MTQEQQELFKSDFGFFHFFRNLIRSGTWAKMSLAAKAIYPVVKSYAAADNGAAFPSYETLKEQSGLSLQSVSNGLKELAELGLITAKTAPGKKTVYSIKETFPVQTPAGNTGSASFDYVPQTVQAAVNELKALITTGAEGKIIQINFNLNCGDIVTNGIQNNIENKIDGVEGAQQVLDMLEKLEKSKAVDSSKITNVENL